MAMLALVLSLSASGLHSHIYRPLSQPAAMYHPVRMSVRTAEQRDVYSGAKDTPNSLADALRDATPRAIGKFALKLAVPVAGGALLTSVALRIGWPTVSFYLLQALQRARSVVLALLGMAFGALTGSTAKELLGRVATRLIDYGVPAVVVGFFVASLKDDGDDEPITASEEDASAKGGLLSRLLKGKGADGASPGPREYLTIEYLGDRLSSYDFSLRRATVSRADALAANRRRVLRRRFADDLGALSDSALAGIVAAEAEWREKASGVAKDAEKARKEMRALSVRMGGAIKPVEKPSPKSPRSLTNAYRRASEKLLDAQEKSLALEAKFLKAASSAMGTDGWEARAALVNLASRPSGWDPLTPPLEAPADTAAARAAPPRAFVFDFQGNTEASSVATLREEVTAVVGTADAARGDMVVVRLLSGGGTVTGYGLAAAQLIRLKEKGLKLTICVEQIAASGGYMMACVADRIVASPFAVLGSIGVVGSVPNVYERLKNEGVEYTTVTAGKFKRTLVPTKKLDPKDVQKTEEELQEIFNLFKAFVARHRPQLDIDDVATGETWFGEDAIEKKLADSLSTFDDTLLELHADGVEIYSVAYREPAEGPFDRLRGPGSDSSFLPPHAAAPANVPLWAARLLRLAFGAPSRASPTAARFEDPRFTSRYTDVAPLY